MKLLVPAIIAVAAAQAPSPVWSPVWSVAFNETQVWSEAGRLQSGGESCHPPSHRAAPRFPPQVKGKTVTTNGTW